MTKIKDEWIKAGKVNKEEYLSLYQESIDNNDNFWRKHSKRLDWHKDFTIIKNIKYSSKDVSIKWFEDGELNVSYNCIDRHAKSNPGKIAIIWEGDNPKNTKSITYKELLENVCKMANVLKKIGVKRR